MENAEMERKSTVVTLNNMTEGNGSDNEVNFPNNSAKKVEFSQAVPLSGGESIKRQQSVTKDQEPPSLSTIQTILGSQMEKEKHGSKGGTSSGASTPIRRRSSPSGSLMNEIRKMSLASQDAKEERQLKKFRRFHGRHRKRREEEYTDKDRAAAVTLGSRDIKHSLRAKKKRERKLCVSTDLLNRENFLSDMLLNEATHQMRIKDIPMALSTLDKALELQPSHKAALVARSQCYLKLGDAVSALKDAEASCEAKDNFMIGLYQCAEALYNLGEFEKALITYHRGARMRQEMEGFRIGIQKCQEAIEKCIGDRVATKIEDLDEILPIIYEMDNFKNQKTNEYSTFSTLLEAGEILHGNRRLKAPPNTQSRWISREILGQIYLDKDYLTKFLTRPDLQRDPSSTSVTAELRENALEALEYIQIREEFWRQQNPIYARKSGFKFNSHVVSSYKIPGRNTTPCVKKTIKSNGVTPGFVNLIQHSLSTATRLTEKVPSNKVKDMTKQPTIRITSLIK